jgi:hypothetical protein
MVMVMGMVMVMVMVVMLIRGCNEAFSVPLNSRGREPRRKEVL